MPRVFARIDGGERELTLGINDPDSDFRIGTERVTDWSLGQVEDRLIDLLDVAGAVFALDGLVTRGQLSRPDLGERWRRQFDVTIGVRDPSFWNEREVRTSLADTLSFLTDDEWSFRFVGCEAAPPRQSYLDFSASPSIQPHAESVVLFSGGLDSLAGAVETLERDQGRVVLVTHRSAPKIIAHQDRLAAKLRSRYGGRVIYMPIRATFSHRNTPERTQRSRSFLFAAFGYVIAMLSGVERLSFYENGIVSHNLPFMPPIIGTMATRTTHPLALQSFEKFLGLLGERPVGVRNEFAWLTKADVIGRLQVFDASELIADTVSCNDVLKRSVEHTHCGACSQCLDRRFGLLSAGLADCEPDSVYETPVLSGARETARSVVTALEWTRHAGRLATIAPEEFVDRFGGELQRIVRGYPGMRPAEVMQRSHAMHRRHGEAVVGVLREELSRIADQVLRVSLPPSSLLIACMTGEAGAPSLAAFGMDRMDLSEEAPPASPDGDTPRSDGLRVTLTRRGADRFVEVDGLGMVTGAPAGPVFALQPHHRADRAAGRSREEHRYLLGSHLIPEAGESKAAVVQNVRRCRRKLAQFYRELHGHSPENHLLVQHRPGRGYRLDPAATVLLEQESGRGAAE